MKWDGSQMRFERFTPTRFFCHYCSFQMTEKRTVFTFYHHFFHNHCALQITNTNEKSAITLHHLFFAIPVHFQWGNFSFFSGFSHFKCRRIQSLSSYHYTFDVFTFRKKENTFCIVTPLYWTFWMGNKTATKAKLTLLWNACSFWLRRVSVYVSFHCIIFRI